MNGNFFNEMQCYAMAQFYVISVNKMIIIYADAFTCRTKYHFPSRLVLVDIFFYFSKNKANKLKIN